MATFKNIEQSFINILGSKAKGAFFVNTEEEYGLIDGGDMSAIEEEILRLDTNEYQALRAAAYPSLAEQVGALMKETVATTQELRDLQNQVSSVKATYPKPE